MCLKVYRERQLSIAPSFSVLMTKKETFRVEKCLNCTWVVAAAPRGAPPPPGALVQGGVPVAEPLALECVGCQVADLQAGEFTHEVSE